MVTTTSSLTNTSALTPAQYEHSKTEQQKSEDWMYTLNHSITCLTVTDMFGLSAAANGINAIKGWFTGKKGTLKLDHDHDHGYGAYNWVKDHIGGKHKDPEYVATITQKEHDRMHGVHDHGDGGHHHHHSEEFVARELTPASSGKQVAGKFWETARLWLVGEAIGDLGAVPFTVALQRYAPGFMQGLRKIIEPVISKQFHKNTERAAISWGEKNGKARDSQEVSDYAHELYEYEMRHMPQMAVWTVSSVLLNFAAMHGLHAYNPKKFPAQTVGDFALVKGTGAAMTAGLMLTIRGFTPGGAHKWDQTVGKHVIAPATKAVGKLVGIKSEDVDAFNKRNELLEKKLEQQPPKTQIAANSVMQNTQSRVNEPTEGHVAGAV